MMDLIDTNVLSELSRQRPDGRVLAWVGDRTELAASVVTVEEIQFGLFARPNPRLVAWFGSFYRPPSPPPPPFRVTAFPRREGRLAVGRLRAATQEPHLQTRADPSGRARGTGGQGAPCRVDILYAAGDAERFRLRVQRADASSDFASNTRSAVSISRRTRPSSNTSLRNDAPSPVSCSGAM